MVKELLCNPSCGKYTVYGACAQIFVILPATVKKGAFHMTNKDILARVDHTLLGVAATAMDYVRLCEEGLAYGVASVCVPPSRVELCASHTAGRLAVCTVVGFPNGYADTEAKAHEAAIAIRRGAVEIDMVIDVGKAKEGDYASILADIRRVRAAVGTNILKVIIETALWWGPPAPTISRPPRVSRLRGRPLMTWPSCANTPPPM
jgi:hypothetical protein